MKLGVIADDFTGATDIALTLAEAIIAMPDLTSEAFDVADVDSDGALSETEFVAGVETGVLPKG